MPAGERSIVYQDRRLTVQFEMDYPGIVRYANESRELGRTLEHLVAYTKRFAESISPVDDRSNQYQQSREPHYRDSWETHPYIERNVGDPPFPRQAQLLINQSRHALLVEFGNGRGDYHQTYGHRIFPKLFDFLEALP